MRYPRIDTGRCIGCAACVEVCPSSQLCLENGVASPCRMVPRPCHGCGHCYAVCPEHAVSIWEDERELVQENLEPEHWRIPLDTLSLFLQMRRSVRFFRKDPVDRALLESLLDRNRWAPTACNRQDVGWIVLESPEARRQLAEAIAEWALQSEGYRSIGEEYRRGHDTVLRGAPCMWPPVFWTAPSRWRIWNFSSPRPVSAAAGPGLRRTWPPNDPIWWNFSAWTVRGRFSAD